MAVKIVVDSASDIDLNEANELGVSFMPIEVRFGEEEFWDGINLTHRQFFEKLIESSELPKTSQINEHRYEECFKEIVSGGDEAVVITLSSKLSGTYENAVKAANNIGNVYVVDSLNATIGERILIKYGLQLVAEGKSGAQIKEILDDKKHDIKLLALLGTLKYLQKGGRISKATAFAGELLNVKPVVAVEDGEVKLVGKALGSKKGNNLLDRLIVSSGGIDYGMPYAVAYSGLDDSVLAKYIEDSADHWQGKTDNIPTYMIGSTIGTHVGPGSIAVAFFCNKNDEN